MKLSAAVLYNSNEPLRIEELEIPPLKEGQILVKIDYSGICHSQLMEIRGKRGKDLYLPHLLGHEGSGTVIDIGQGVAKVKPGDDVILGWIKGEGINAPGPKYEKNGIIINAGAVTTFSTYSVVSENRCVKLPNGLPKNLAVLFGCAILTGAGMVLNHVQPVPGASIAVFGLGGIGLSALMAVNLYKCNPVIAIDIEEDKLSLAREFGATHLINSKSQNAVTAIMEMTQAKGVDYAIEASGHAEIIQTAFSVVRKFGGLCVFATHPAAHERLCLDPFDLVSGKRIEGSWGGESKPDHDIPKLFDLYQKGKLPLEKLISQSYSLMQINQAFSDLENRRIVRALINMASN